MVTSTKSSKSEKSRWGRDIVVPALGSSLVKLNPRTLAKNPVMFVVEVGAVLTSVDLVRGLIHHSQGFGFSLQITVWLWFTVLFANFAEAIAAGPIGNYCATSVREWLDRIGARIETAAG